MVTTFKGLANKWVVLALLLASIGAVLAITLLPAGAQSDTIMYAENGTDPVANFTAVDPEGRQVTWSMLSAAGDNEDFNLKDGVLSFKESPNFEAPADADTDNVYELTLTASDGTVTTDETVMVQVTNVDEAATTVIEVELVQPREGEMVTVVYADSVGNPYVSALGVANDSIVDPDMGKDDGDTTAIPAEDVSWQWSRGTTRTGTFTPITESENPTRDAAVYDVIDADRNYFLRVTATYEDGHDEGKTLTATSLRAVQRLRADVVPPAFPADFDTSTPTVLDPPSVEIADGAEAGSNVGNPVVATRETAEGEILTYSLVQAPGGTPAHADLFQIDRLTGQVSVGIGKTVNPASDGNSNVPDPKGDSFTVQIEATDGVPENEESTGDMVVMTITVTATDEDPVFINGDTSHEFAEIPAGTTPEADALNVYTFEAYDPEDGAVTYTLSGTDADKFTTAADDVLTGGILTFANAPDYENAADENKDNVYEITVKAAATSDTNADGDATTDPEELSNSIDVTVTVTNAQDPGSLSMSARQPRIGVPISAINLSDLDGRVTNVAYQWSRSEAGSAGTPLTDADCATTTDWEDAEGDGANTDTYTPELDDDGKCLRARATYNDPEGNGNAEVPSTEVVEKARNLQPMFGDEIGPRYVVENAAEDAVVIAAESGAAADAVADDDRVIATDILDADDTDNGSISYGLSGPDANYFDINNDPTGGQISISAAGAGKLDYETRRTYTVTVTATDLEGLNSSTRVTINVVDVNEGPEIERGNLAVSGEPLVEYDSMGTNAVATYTAVGVDSEGATWSLSGDDAGDFSISAGGVLTFNSPPNHSTPTDANGDSIYMVAVVATSTGGMTAEKMVTVTVGMMTAPAERTDISQYTNQERFDLDGNGIVDASEIQQALIIWAQDNPEN